MHSVNRPATMHIPKRRSLHKVEGTPWFSRWWVWALLLAAAAVPGFLLGQAQRPHLAPERGTSLSEDRIHEPAAGDSAVTPPLGEEPLSEPGGGPLALTSAGYETFPELEFRGSGDEILSDLDLTGPVALSFDCPACAGKVAVSTDLAGNHQPIKVDGAFAGTIILAAEGQALGQVSVEADSTWTLLLRDLDSLPSIAGNMDAMGFNSFIYTGGSTRALVTHSGEGRFTLYVYGIDAQPVVDTVGAFEGYVQLTQGVVSVHTEGMWSLEPEE